MTVASQCIREPFAFHHDKRNATRERPFLVWTGRVKLNAGGKQLVARWNDCYRWVVRGSGFLPQDFSHNLSLC